MRWSCERDGAVVLATAPRRPYVEKMSKDARPGLDGPGSDALLRAGRFFTRWDETDDGRAVFREGGRAGDVFYRDRWSHDKVVRSTHGVNCTGSCSWKVYVKDGIITWESQQTDYPSVGPGPARVRAPRLPAGRGVLLVHLLAHPGPLPLRPRRARRDVPRGARAARRPGARLGRRSSATRSGGAATSRPAARAAWSG